MSLAILPLPLGRQEPRTAGPGGHGANGSRSRFDPSRGGRGDSAMFQLQGWGSLFSNVLLMITAYCEMHPPLRECPNCGCTNPVVIWMNSSDELQCDNCGYSETE